MKLHWLLLLAAGLATAPAVQSAEFPRPAAIEADIQFWTRVYTEIDTDSGFIHDSRNLGVVYETLRFAPDSSRRSRSRQRKAATGRIRDILERLAAGEREGLSREEQRVLELWPPDVTNAELRSAAGRLRFQLGQANRFRAGLIRAGTWKPYIESVLEERGLPRELAALPHVESSFDPTAYSKVGAAGMWQFTRSTGLRYMRIDHIVDERRDPFHSTVAAARLLENNYEVLQSWPLAITAYNHGQAGMRQAKQRLGTDRIEVILRDYNGRTFGFASRNFYVAFLAAVDVDARAEEFFGPLRPNSPADTVVVEVPDFVSVDTLRAALDVDLRTLRRWNPALTESVWSGEKFVPKGFSLRLPSTVLEDPGTRLAAVPASQRYTAQKPDIFHRVQRGDTISGIADRYRVSVNSLVQLNNLRSRHFIRAGQVLRLPGNDGTTPMTLAQLAGAPADAVYVVRAGDSVDRISRQFGISETVLLAHNGIANRNLIYVGQELRVGGLPEAGTEPGEDVTIAPASVPAEMIAARAEEAPALTGERPPSAVRSQPTALASAAADAAPADASAPVAMVEERRLLAAEAALAVVMDSVPPESPLDPVPDSQAGPPLDPEPDPALGLDETDESSADTNVLASVQAEMAADPSDYLVREDDTIEVQALETLGHYADWLQIRTQRLRDINRMPFRQAVVIGRRLKLDFSVVDERTFEARRVEYQRRMQEAFFMTYQVTDTQDHVVRPGESLWVLALRRYRVPVWLVRQYNPDLDLDQVRPGTVVKFPALKPIAATEGGTRAAN